MYSKLIQNTECSLLIFEKAIMSIQVSIIIPTFKEKGNISFLLDSILSLLKQYSYEIIVVDENSPDGTGEIVEEYVKKSKGIYLYYHQGKPDLGDSILLGLRKATGKIIIGMDADFNHDPSVLPHLVEALKKADLAVASRFVKGGGMENKLRYTATYIFNLLLKIFFRYPIQDITSGYYAIWRDKLMMLPISDIYRGYGEYHLRLLHYASIRGYSIVRVPVFYKNRKYGRSKSRLLAMAFQYIRTSLEMVNKK